MVSHVQVNTTKFHAQILLRHKLGSSPFGIYINLCNSSNFTIGYIRHAIFPKASAYCRCNYNVSRYTSHALPFIPSLSLSFATHAIISLFIDAAVEAVGVSVSRDFRENERGTCRKGLDRASRRKWRPRQCTQLRSPKRGARERIKTGTECQMLSRSRVYLAASILARDTRPVSLSFSFLFCCCSLSLSFFFVFFHGCENTRALTRVQRRPEVYEFDDAARLIWYCFIRTGANIIIANTSNVIVKKEYTYIV